MKSTMIILCGLSLVLGTLMWPATAADPETKTETDATLKTDDDKTLYALGQLIAGNLKAFDLTDAEFKVVVGGMSDVINSQPSKVEMKTYGPKIDAMARKRIAAGTEKEKARSAAFLKAEAAKKGAVQTASGLVYVHTKVGDGASPTATDNVTVHYHGMLSDGTVFDSSVDRGQPASFRLNQVIKGWTEGLQLMKKGGKTRFVIPSDIAYGDQGRPPKIPGGAVLVFEVELIEISK